MPVNRRDGDFGIIDKLTRVLDGGGVTRIVPTSWDIEEEGERRESGKSANRKRKIPYLVDGLETKACRATKKITSEDELSENGGMWQRQLRDQMEKGL